MLFTVIPSELYFGDATLDTLMQSMVNDLNQTYDQGVDATKDPGEDLQVNKQSTVKPCIRALLQWAAAMIKVMVRRSAEHVIIHEPSYTTCMTCNWKINSNVLGISTPPSPGALWARRRTLR